MKKIIPYSDDINDERVKIAVAGVVARGGIITRNPYIKTETTGYADPPGIAFKYTI